MWYQLLVNDRPTAYIARRDSKEEAIRDLRRASKLAYLSSGYYAFTVRELGDFNLIVC